MARTWTSAQKSAIESKGSNLLLAAAAGSGKTAVLVERIIKMVTDDKAPVDVDKLLVLTFTKSAAGEMKERIMSALSEELEKNPDSVNLSRQLMLAQKASITTIHSFCNDLLKTNFSLADVDPNFRIADTTENELLRLSALQEVVDEIYEDDEFGENFAQLTMCYSSVKNNDALYELIDSIYSFCMSLPNPKKWLKDSSFKFNAEMYRDFDETDWSNILVSYFKSKIEKMLFEYDFMIKKADSDDGGETLCSFLLQEKEQFVSLLKICKYSEMKDAVDNIVFERIVAKPKNSQPMYRDLILKMRKDLRDDFKKLTGKIFNLSGKEQLETIRELYPLMRVLSEVVLRFSKRFDEKKEKKNILNFNDLEHKTYHLLVNEDGFPSDFAKTIKEKYHEILIDEYQDISRLQEAIFEAIKRENNLFMVGDLKQSIYRFRNTDPLLFKQKKEIFENREDAKNRKIILSKNFRSRKHILDCINFIFERIMSDEVGEIEYDREEMLYFGADYDENNSLVTELNIIDTKEINESSDGDTIENVTAEAYLTAKKISELIENDTEVKAKDGVRKITFKDICILMRAPKDRAEVFANVLSQMGIPCYSDKSGSLLESEEIEVVMSLLRLIDNPHQDIPLLCVLRSQMYRFSTNDLANIRIKNRKVSFYDAMCQKAKDNDKTGIKTKLFLKELAHFRERSGFFSVSELIWHIYMQTGFYDYQLALNNGELKQRNLRILFTRAEEYEKTGVKGLYGFINFIDEYQGGGGKYDAAREIGEEHNVVRIMSIHKSKGLEFPVVIFCGIGKQFDKRDLNKNVIFHPEIGYGPKYIDLLKNITYQNGVRSAVRIKKDLELISEEMRILYVALTRAKERLILIGASKKLDNIINRYAVLKSNKRKIERFKAEEALTYLEWFVAALINHPDGGPLRDRTDEQINYCEDKSRWKINIYESAEELLNQMKEENTVSETDEISDISEVVKNASWEYPFIFDVSVPSKISVTELKRKIYEENEENCVYLYNNNTIKDKDELTSAQKGTAMHTVMEKLDFSAVKSIDDIKNKVMEIFKSGALSMQEAESIDVHKIMSFVNSDSCKMLNSADSVCKEVMFAININAAEVNKDYSGDAEVMLQGIIDCVAITDDEIYILDYKTDKVKNIEEIISKYKIQLDLYAKAAEIIYKKPVTKKILYLFDKNISIEV